MTTRRRARAVARVARRVSCVGCAVCRQWRVASLHQSTIAHTERTRSTIAQKSSKRSSRKSTSWPACMGSGLGLGLGSGNSEQATHEAHVRRRHGPVGRALQRAKRGAPLAQREHHVRSWATIPTRALADAAHLDRLLVVEPLDLGGQGLDDQQHQAARHREGARHLRRARQVWCNHPKGGVTPPKVSGMGGAEPPEGRRSGSRRRRLRRATGWRLWSRRASPRWRRRRPSRRRT